MEQLLQEEKYETVSIVALKCYVEFDKIINSFVLDDLRIFLNNLNESLKTDKEMNAVSFSERSVKKGYKAIWDITLGNTLWLMENAKEIPISVITKSLTTASNLSELTRAIRKTVMEDMRLHPIKWTDYFSFARLLLEGDDKVWG